MSSLLARHGGEIVYKTTRDNGGMFRSTLGIEKISDENFRAFVSDSWGGGIQCFRSTEELAKAELPRLWEKMYG